MNTPLLSILTPTHQRCRYLSNIWRSLCHQSFTNFEWLIGIDGDADDSVLIARSICSMTSLNVRVFWSDLHVGKSVIDNILINESKGKWLLWCDSDDYFFPDSIQDLASFVEALSDRSHQITPSIVLAPLADNLKSPRNTSDSCSSSPAQSFPTITTYDLLRKQYANISDFMMCIDKSLFANARFPEVDYYTPEGVLYKQFKNEPAAMFSEIIMVRKYLSDGITLSRKILYPRGKFEVYRQALLNQEFEKLSFMSQFRIHIQYVRFAFHARQPVSLLFQSNQSGFYNVLLRFIGLFILICGSGLFLADLLMRRVVRTDKEFLRNYLNYRLYSFSS